MAKNDNNVCFRTSIGGQALMEGILMRGPDKQAIVCRTENGIVEKVEPLNLPKDKYPILGWPFVRGIVTFADSMVKGMRALTYSASLLPEEEQEQPSKFDLWLEKKLAARRLKSTSSASRPCSAYCWPSPCSYFCPRSLRASSPALRDTTPCAASSRA